MKILFLLLIVLLTINLGSFAQCSGSATSNASGNWTGAIWTYTGGATSPNNACLVYIAAGHTVTVSNAQTSSASIEVRGILDLSNQLRLGTTTGCGQSLRIYDSGQLTGDASNDRLSVCGVVKVTGQPTPPAGAIDWPADGGFTAGDLGGNGFGFGEAPGILPVELISFESRINNKSVAISWSTASQLNFSHFEIEHSINAKDWTMLTSMKGEGTTNELLMYTYAHNLPYNGKNYYRLRMVDLDETFEYSDILSVNVQANQAISLSPNPTKGGTVRYELNFAPEIGDHVVVYDLVGGVVASQAVLSFTGDLELPASMTRGTYLVRYKGKSVQQVLRLLVD